MSRPGELPTLPATTRLQYPTSISHSVVKFLYLIILYHKRRHLAQVSAQFLHIHLQLLLLITSQIAPLQPLRLLFFPQCSLPSPTRSIDHERCTPPFASVKPRYSSSPRTPQSSNPSLYEITFLHSPHRLILSSMVLLKISVSDSIGQHSRTVLQHSAPH